MILPWQNGLQALDLTADKPYSFRQSPILAAWAAGEPVMTGMPATPLDMAVGLAALVSGSFDNVDRR